jgi:two-component system LytT family response regulator/two-component system response regulator AlgR
MDALKIALVDDEVLARDRLARMLRESGCEVVGEFEGAKGLLAWMKDRPAVDALFLDIQMPGGTGMELLAEIQDPPPVVFVTAFSEHAIRAFEVAAVDYILKPVFEDRLEKTLARLRSGERPRPLEAAKPAAPAAAPQRFTAKLGSERLFLDLRRVTHFELDDEIVWAWVGGKRFRAPWGSLAEVETAFPDSGMVRIQRHLLLRPQAVLSFRTLWGARGKVRVAEGTELEVSRSAWPKLRQVLGVA